MKSPNLFFKTLLFTFIGTAFFLGLAIFSISQASKENPDVWKKLGQRFGVQIATGKNFGVVFDSHSENVSASRAQNRWSFKAPEHVLRLKAVSAEIEVIQGQGSEVVIEASALQSGDSEGKLLESQVDDGNLTLVTPEDASLDQLRIQVQIPKDYRQKISVHNVGGTVSMKDLEFEAVDVKMVSGEVQLTNVISEATTVKTVSGAVSIDNKRPSNIKIVTVSGEASLQVADASSTEFELKSVSGDVRNSVSSDPKGKYKVSVKTTSGDIRIFQK